LVLFFVCFLACFCSKTDGFFGLLLFTFLIVCVCV
jgi:hypothetical protein